MITEVAVIGMGSIAARHLANIKRCWPNISTICASSSGRIPDEQIANIDQFCSNMDDVVAKVPDLAIVASPATLHAAHTRKFLEKGIPVLIEKPIAASVGEAESLLSCLKEKSITAGIGYCLRFSPAAGVLREAINQNILGTIYSVFVHVGQYLPDWRRDKPYQDTVTASKALGGGVLLELSHEFDYLQWFFGTLHYQHAQLRSSNELGLEVEEIADVVLSTRNGAVCTVHMNCLQKKPQRYCQIVGEKGELTWNLVDNNVMHSSSDGDKYLYSDAAWDRNQMYVSMLENFFHSCDQKVFDAVRLEEAVNTVKLIGEIKEKAVTGPRL